MNDTTNDSPAVWTAQDGATMLHDCMNQPAVAVMQGTQRVALTLGMQAQERARLLAAAPEMYLALCALLDADAGITPMSFATARGIARAALAKANGGAA